MKHCYLTLLLALLLSSAAHAHNFEVDGIYYNITSSEDLTVEVTYKGGSYTAYSDEYTGSVTIPATVTYDGTAYSVTAIGDLAFRQCSSLTSVTIPEGVTSIGEGAFHYCSGLTSITIPESVTSIGYNAFNGTAWYENQPDGVVYAGKMAYTYKGTMPEGTSITLKEGTKGIASYAFYNCTGLTSVTIPESVTTIGGGAFSACTGLTSVTIPEGVTSIGDYAFSGCTGLTSVTIPESVTSIGGAAF